MTTQASGRGGGGVPRRTTPVVSRQQRASEGPAGTHRRTAHPRGTAPRQQSRRAGLRQRPCSAQTAGVVLSGAARAWDDDTRTHGLFDSTLKLNAMGKDVQGRGPSATAPLDPSISAPSGQPGKKPSSCNGRRRASRPRSAPTGRSGTPRGFLRQRLGNLLRVTHSRETAAVGEDRTPTEQHGEVLASAAVNVSGAQAGWSTEVGGDDSVPRAPLVEDASAPQQALVTGAWLSRPLSGSHAASSVLSVTPSPSADHPVPIPRPGTSENESSSETPQWAGSAFHAPPLDMGLELPSMTQLKVVHVQRGSRVDAARILKSSACSLEDERGHATPLRFTAAETAGERRAEGMSFIAPPLQDPEWRGSDDPQRNQPQRPLSTSLGLSAGTHASERSLDAAHSQVAQLQFHTATWQLRSASVKHITALTDAILDHILEDTVGVLERESANPQRPRVEVATFNDGQLRHETAAPQRPCVETTNDFHSQLEKDLAWKYAHSRSQVQENVREPAVDITSMTADSPSDLFCTALAQEQTWSLDQYRRAFREHCMATREVGLEDAGAASWTIWPQLADSIAEAVVDSAINEVHEALEKMVDNMILEEVGLL